MILFFHSSSLNIIIIIIIMRSIIILIIILIIIYLNMRPQRIMLRKMPERMMHAPLSPQVNEFDQLN